MKDLEGLEVPNPYTDGMYPGWLWANREMRRIFDKYQIPMPIWTSMCPGPTEVAMTGMMGWTQFQVALRKNPELARACADLALQWNIRLGRALIDVAQPEGIYCCQFTGGFPLKGNEWVADQWRVLGENLKTYSPKPLHLSHGYSFLSGVFQWYEVLHERGALTPDMWDGGTGGWSEDMDMWRILDAHRGYNLYLSFSIRNETLEKGPISAIEEEMKTWCEKGKSHPKFSPGVVPVYFCPPEHVDAAIAAFKNYNK
jgi:hypothetical protein